MEKSMEYISRLNVNELFEELKTTKQLEEDVAEINEHVDIALEIIKNAAAETKSFHLLMAYQVIGIYIESTRKILDDSIRDKKEALSEREDEIIQRGE